MEKHAPIVITSVTDFTHPQDTAGCRCVRGGAGTRDDPFVIGWWEIETGGGNGISIGREEGMGVYVKLTNLEIAGADEGHVGISLIGMNYSKVENSTITGTQIAVNLFVSGFIQMSYVNVERSSLGVKVETSSDNLILSNSFTSCELAIWIRGPNNRVIQNRITSCYKGVNLDGDGGRAANDNVVEGNIITDGGDEGYGIALYRAHNNQITGNRVERMGRFGGIILAEPSNGNSVSHNTVHQNKGSGIYVIPGSSKNTITFNVVQGNGDGVSSFDLYDESNPGLNVWANNQYNTRNRNDIG
jgi:parallel beta-helix repeat protein